MAYTRAWSDAWSFATSIWKGGVAASNVAETVCDLVNTEIETSYPWKERVTRIASSSIPLVDGTQDYSVPPNIFRPLRMWLLRTDTTPDQTLDVELRQNLPIDLITRSWDSIRSISFDAGSGQIRLDGAVSIPTGVTVEIGGEYQRNPDKITALSQQFFFADHYFMVPVKGILYWLHRLGDDTRAGSTQDAQPSKGTAYSGEYAEFRAAIDDMARREDYGENDSYFPDDTLGAGRDGSNLSGAAFIFGN